MAARGLEQIVAEMRSRQDHLADEIAIIICDEIPAYAEMAEDAAFAAELRSAIKEHEEALAAHLRAGRRLEATDLDYVRRSALARARVGLPIADYLRALRLGQRRLWEEVLALAGPRDSALIAAATRNLMEYIDDAAVIATEAYVEMQQSMLADGDRVRRDLLEDLLLGREPAPGPCRAAARSAGLDWSTPCLVLVADHRGEVSDDQHLREAASMLADAVADRVRPLTVVRRQEIVVVRTVRKRPVRLAKALQSVQRQLHRQQLDIAIGVSTVHDRPADLPAAYAEATVAVDMARLRGEPLVFAELRTFEYLTLRADETAGRLVPPMVRQLALEDAANGGTVADTLRAYVAADLNAKVTAERLGIHVNTVHYRLARIAEKASCDLHDLDDVVDLLVATQLAAGSNPSVEPSTDAVAGRRMAEPVAERQ